MRLPRLGIRLSQGALALCTRVDRRSRLALALVACTGCQRDLAEIDSVFYDWSPRAMHCAVNIDSSDGVSDASIDRALDRAQRRGEVLELYTHHPGVTVPVSVIEHVLAGARDRGLAFYTYADFANSATSPAAGLALSFDDTSVDAWWALRPTFQQYGARITFFVSRYQFLEDGQRAEIKDLADDGHDIEAHTVMHLRGPDVVEAKGLAAYMSEEVVPSIELLRGDGYAVPAFAYPFGARTDETDHAILAQVSVLRSVQFTYPEADSPCPL
jgi:hypothetical protein